MTPSLATNFDLLATFRKKVRRVTLSSMAWLDHRFLQDAGMFESSNINFSTLGMALSHYGSQSRTTSVILCWCAVSHVVKMD